MSCLLDPSAPGVSKQMMLDWMHINHPKTTIRPRIDPASLAQLVRSVQPECKFFAFKTSLMCYENWLSYLLSHIFCWYIDFSDPISDARANSAPGDMGSATSNHPKYPALQEDQDLKPLIPESFKTKTGIGRQAKQLASSEVRKSPKNTDLGVWMINVSFFAGKISQRKIFLHFIKDRRYLV